MKENSGWFLIHRKLFDNDLWLSEKFTKAQAWIDIVGNANHTDKFIFIRGHRIEVKRGQLAWSELTMAKRWRWSRHRVSDFLKYLEKMVQQIEQQKNTFTTLCTVINYDLYQNKGQQKGHQKDIKRTSKGTQLINDKELNNVKKGEVDNKFILEVEKLFPMLKVEEELEKWQDWKKSRGRVFKDNQAAFRNWLRKSKEYFLERNPQPEPPTNKKITDPLVKAIIERDKKGGEFFE